jgi:hypothetical protein
MRGKSKSVADTDVSAISVTPQAVLILSRAITLEQGKEAMQGLK